MFESEGVQTPKEVIDDIRNGDYLLDVENESAKVKRGARSLQEKLNRTLKLLSEDLYSKQTHFVLELLQNADDNTYAPDVFPQLTFKVFPDRLVLVNNELGFEEKHVRALCDVGKSSKTKKSGYIGEKGIGFKSVFTVSDTPEIHSNGYHFRFDRSNENNLLGYVVPIWCCANKEAPDGVTTIILPAKAGFNFDSNTVEDIDSRLLLFLNKIRELTLEQNSTKVTYCRRDAEGLSHLSTHREQPGQANLIEELRFARVEVAFQMGKVSDEKRPGFDTSSVVLAFPVDAKGAAAPQPTSQVFAFLPIRQCGFKFSVQADFILSSSREDILTDRPWNKGLRNTIAVAFQHSVEQFKKIDALAFSYLKFLPTESEVVDPFFKPVVAQTVRLLSETQCLPSASGLWKVPKELRYGFRSFRELFPSPVAGQLFKFDYVDERVQADHNLLQKLGVQPIMYVDYVNVFKSHGNWFKQQPLIWKAKFYAALADLERNPLLNAGLKSAPCIPTSAGDFAVPQRATVFYPLSRGRKYGFESELTIVDNELLDEAMKYSSRVNDLFRSLNVKVDDPYDIVTSHILPKHKGESWKRSENEALIGHLRYIKDKLNQYLTGAASAGKTADQALAMIRDGLWIGTKGKRDNSWIFDRGENLYFGKEYKPRFCIESLLGEGIEQSSLVSADYIVDRTKDSDTEAEEWRLFLAQLGVRFAPKLTNTPDGDWHCSPELKLLLGSPHSSVRKATLECVDQHWSAYRSCLVMEAKIGRSNILKETGFATALRSMNAPTRRRTSVPIAQCYYPTPEIKDLFGDQPTYVDANLKNAELLDACQITHRLDARACIKRLQQLKAEGGDTTPQLHALYRNLERFWNKEGAYIKQAFSQDALIRVKGIRPVWARPDEVTWKSNGTFLDSLYPPLQGQYRDFSALFHGKIGVPKELPTAKWIDALSRVGEIESLEERRREANAIYRRASRDLTPHFKREEVQSPPWLETFESDEVFLNQRDELVANNEYLFVNDAPELAKLFSDDENISLLAIPFEDLPRVGRLLEAAKVQFLSKSVDVEAVEVSGGQVRTDLTIRVRQAIPFVCRVLYAKEHDKFESAVAGGLFARLQGIEVVEVPELTLQVTLAGVTREMPADVAASGERILLQSGARSLKHQLAIGLRQILGASEDLTDAMSLILMADDIQDIEYFLHIRRVAPLPTEIQTSLTGDDWRQPARCESEDASEESQVDTGSDDAEGIEVEPESPLPEESALTEPSDKAGSRSREDAVDRALTELNGRTGDVRPAPRQDPIPPRSPSNAPHGVPIRTLTTVLGPVVRGNGSTLASDGEVPTEFSDVSRGDASRAAPSDTETETGEASAHPGTPTVPVTQSPTQVPPRVGEFSAPTSNASGSRRKQKRERGAQQRTRAGRLLSYAASPEEALQQLESDSAEQASARNATGQAAVDHFLATQGSRWKSLTPMPHNNPGFDVKAIAHDGSEEFIEIKGQSGAWTEEGVALTPTELIAAQRAGEHYWLCVVEYVHDENRRAVHLVKNPFGLTCQFRFDSGWRSVALRDTANPLKPEVGVLIEIPGEGRGRILSSRKKGQFYKLHVILDAGGDVHRTFNPATMNLFAE